VTRKAKALARDDVAGLVHKNRGRKTNNRKPDNLREWYLQTYRSKYAPHNFNFKHAFPFINEQVHPSALGCYSTFATSCLHAAFGQVKKRRRTNKARILG
jgi:hypothetical protein